MRVLSWRRLNWWEPSRAAGAKSAPTIQLQIAVVAIFLLSTGATVAQEFSFSTVLLKDTVLTYESIYFKATVKNNSSGSIYIRPFGASEEFLDVKLTRSETGERIKSCGLSINYLPDSGSSPTLEPGEEESQVLDILYRSCLRDSASNLPYWPSGTYEVVFAYTYDPWKRPLFGSTSVVYDTVELTVRDNRGIDAEALSALGGGMTHLRRGKHHEAMLSFWSVVSSYPSSPYSSEACVQMTYLAGAGIPLPPTDDRAQMLSTLISGAAYRDCVTLLVDQLAGMSPVEKRKAYLHELIDRLPKSYAARRAAQILSAQSSDEDHD